MIVPWPEGSRSSGAKTDPAGLYHRIMAPYYSTATTRIRWTEATGEDGRPLIMCEQSQAMGNSNGSGQIVPRPSLMKRHQEAVLSGSGATKACMKSMNAVRRIVPMAATSATNRTM